MEELEGALRPKKDPSATSRKRRGSPVGMTGCAYGRAAEWGRLKAAATLLMERGTDRRVKLLVGFIDDFASDYGGDDFSGVDVLRIDVEEILIEDDDVCNFAGFDGAFRFFASTGVSGTGCVTFNRLRDSEALRGNETATGFAIAGLPRDGSLQPFPWI